MSEEVAGEAVEGAPEAGRPKPGSWGWMVLGAAALGLGRLLGPVGVDTVVLGELAGSGRLPLPSVAIVGQSLTLLLLAWALVVALRAGTGARRVIAGIYLALSAIQGIATAMWLESLNATSPFGDIVAEPGWGFRLLNAAAWTGGAALLWWIAARIEASGRARGPLFLWLVGQILACLLAAGDVGTWASQQASLMPLVVWLATPVSLLVVAGATALKPHRAWPVRLIGVELFSAWDVVALAAVAALPGLLLSALALLGPDLGTTLTDLLNLGFPVVVTVMAVVWWQRVSDGEGSRPLGVLLVTLLGALVPAALAVFSFVVTGGVQAMTAPGPLEGEASFELVLEADDRDGFGRDDGQVMLARLEALGAEATIVDMTPTTITLRVDAARDAQSVLDALRPHRLGLHLLGPGIPDDLTPPPELRRSVLDVYIESPPMVLRGDCEAARGFATAAVPGCLLGVEVEPSESYGDDLDEAPASCRVVCLEPEPAVAHEDVATAEVSMDDMLGQPTVLFEMTDDGAERLRAATSANLRRPLVIVVDGEILSMPIIQSAISERGQITLGTQGDVDAMLLEAAALAAALEADGTISPWHLAEERMPSN